MPIEANNPSTRESYERPAPPIEDKEPSTPSSRRLSPSNTHLAKILPHTTKLSAFHPSMAQFYPRNILLLPPEYATDNPILDVAMADIIKATRDLDINDTALMNVLLESLGHSELYVRPITRQWIVELLEAASSKMAGTRGAGLWEIIVRISPERYFVCPRHMEGAVKCYVQMIDAVDKNSEAFIEENLKARLSRIIQPEPPRVNIGVICTSCQWYRLKCNRSIPCSECVRRDLPGCVYPERPQYSHFSRSVGPFYIVPMNLDTNTEATVTTAANGTSPAPLDPGRTPKKTHAPATGPDNAQQMPDPPQVSSNATTCDSFAPSTGPQSRYDEAASATVSSLIRIDPPSDTISHFALQASPLPPVSSRKRARPPSPALDPTAHSPSPKRAKTNSELQLPTEAEGSVHTALYQLQGNYSEHPLENIDALGPNILDQVVGVQSVRSNEMTALGMFKCLTEHGCSDLRSLIDPNRFSSHRVAEGGFGDVWKGQLTDGTRVAVKVLRYGLIREDGSKSIKRATREIYNWSKLEHNNIHKLLGVTMFQERLGMVSIWMEHGTLQQYLNQRDDINRRELCLQIAEGVVYLHGVNMIHGDLKASNILVSPEGILKLTDFDYSIISDCSLVFSATTRIGGGTLRWMAPELVIDEEPVERSKMTDIYALGMTFLETLTNALPYSECHRDAHIYGKLARRERPKRSGEHFPANEHGNAMWELLIQCWDYDPPSRPTASQVLNILGAIQ